MTKVTLTGYIIVPKNELERVISALVLHKKLTLEEMGCLTFSVTQDCNNQQKFNVFEEFIDKQAFEKHQERVKQSDWGNVTVNVSRHYQVMFS